MNKTCYTAAVGNFQYSMKPKREARLLKKTTESMVTGILNRSRKKKHRLVAFAMSLSSAKIMIFAKVWCSATTYKIAHIKEPTVKQMLPVPCNARDNITQLQN